MKGYLGIGKDRLIAANSCRTAREIAGQPRVWRDSDAEVARHRKRIEAWVGPQLEDPRLRLILCGAGSSSFIGQTLAPSLGAKLRHRVEAISTTHLVSHPGVYLAEELPTLMVSFSRSGDSPESVAGIELANRLLGDCRHLVVTCNRQGRLARFSAGDPDTLCLRLPARACDRGFAMTGSYTSMLVSCAGIFTPDPEQLERAVRSSHRVIERLAARARALAGARFKRLVVLGSGCLLATAREACLKVLELTNGVVVPVSDTPLGFRHGPKCVINGDTCVVMLVSNDAHAARYDLDLLREIDADARAGQIVALHGRTGRPNGGGSGEARTGHPFAPEVLARLGAGGRTELVTVAAEDPNEGAPPRDDFWLSLPYLVFCQMFAFFKALDLGVPVDDPCPSGEVNRVVRGVTIHPYPE